jgi:hypothetical protein
MKAAPMLFYHRNIYKSCRKYIQNFPSHGHWSAGGGKTGKLLNY